MANPPVLNRVYDGEENFQIGVNSLDDPSKGLAGQIAWLYNGVTHGNSISTRPPYKSILRTNGSRAQGCCWFTPTNGKIQFIFAIDGKIYSTQYPFQTCSRLKNIQFYPYVDMIVFKEAVQTVDSGVDRAAGPRAVLMMQDGTSRAAFYDGQENRHLDPKPRTNADPAAPSETVIGLWMEWIGGRLWVANGRQLYASDIDDPLHFIETQYLAGGGSFQCPDGQEITGLKRTSNAKQLLAFTLGNTTRISAGITNRISWTTTPDFIAVLFPGVGCVSGKSAWDASGEIVWFGTDGVHFYNAVGESVQNAKNSSSSQEMLRSFKNISPTISRVCAFNFQSYIGFSVPSGDVYNRHTWVLDTSSSDKLTSQMPYAWQGVWTGIRPVEWAVANVNGKDRCFCLSQDQDAVRIWEAFAEGDGDNGNPITCFAETRGHTFGKGYNFKIFKFGEMYLNHLFGEAHLDVDFKTEFTCWHQIGNFDICATNCIPEECPPLPSLNQQCRYFKTEQPGDDPNEGGSPYLNNIGTWMQLRMRWTGKIGISRYRLSADEYQEDPKGDLNFGDKECVTLACCSGEPDYISVADDTNCYYYSSADGCCESGGNPTL